MTLAGRGVRCNARAMSDSKALLGVDQSLSQRRWRDRLDMEGVARAMALAQAQGLSDMLARGGVARGVTMESVENWLDPSLRNLMPDPDVLTDMKPAVERLAQAARKGEIVAVFGDYDVDGATATALLANFLNACGCETIVHIPDRIFEGYGPNSEAIATLQARGATLLVTVDCGTTSIDPFAEARRLGLDVIVLDHHQAPEALPETIAIVNPNRQDDLSGLGYLCAAGVVYMTLVGLNRALRQSGFWTDQRPAPPLLADLDLVALGTVADVVPLIGLNRAFVTRGLQIMKNRGRPGLTALMDAAGAHGPARPYHLGFLVGPRINAGGRIGDAALGARLLMTSDPIEAGRVAAELDRLNRERQAIETATLAQADAMADQSAESAVLIVGSDEWHPGVVGLVASRLKDRYRRPVFAIAFTGDIGTGSGRSIAGVDLGRAVRGAVDAGLLVKGGGHAMAAGLTVQRGRLDALRTYLDDALGADVARARAEEVLSLDGVLTAQGARASLIKELERAGPFGAGNSEPVFAFADQRITDAGEVGQGHVRLRAMGPDGGRLQAIAFRAASSPLGQALLAAKGNVMHLAGTLSIDHWGGQERVQLRLLDAAAGGGRQISTQTPRLIAGSGQAWEICSLMPLLALPGRGSAIIRPAYALRASLFGGAGYPRPSSSGLGRRPFTAKTGVRVPLGAPIRKIEPGVALKCPCEGAHIRTAGTRMGSRHLAQTASSNEGGESGTGRGTSGDGATARAKLIVLLVEDDPRDAKIMIEYLSRSRYFDAQIEHATDVRTALQHLAGTHYDLMILDYWVGTDSSLTLLRRGSSDTWHIPALVVSSVEAADVQGMGLSAGALGFLHKNDLSPSTLDAVIRTVFHMRDAALELRRSLAEQARGKAQLAETMSEMTHEVLTTLSAVHGFGELLTANASGQPVAPSDPSVFVEQIKARSQKLDALLRRFIEIEAKAHVAPDLYFERANVVDIVKSVVMTMAEKCRQRSQGISVRVAPGDFEAEIDKVAVFQMLVNTVNNAHRYADAGTTIEIVVRDIGTALRINVADQGAGMTDEEIAKASQHDAQKKLPADLLAAGHGLGLLVATSIAQLHGGDLTIVSQKDWGSTVTIELPKVRPTIN